MRTDNTPRILVVDDERANLTLMAEALKPDFRAIIAKSGAQAIERALSPTPPDLILLDILMPEMDGYEVCRILKADDRTRHIPVIFVSAMSEVGNETLGLETGAIDYITKPFNPAIVRARVKTHLESAMARARITALLDNSGQGFLSFGRDLLVDEQYSRECHNILGASIAGLPIPDLLYPEGESARGTFSGNLERILAETDDFKADLYLSLLPTEFHLNGRFLRAEYRKLRKGKLMLVLTDITNARELEREIHLERARLKLIVSAVREAMDFFDVLKSFEDFNGRQLDAILASQAPPSRMIDEVYRSVHTFKALFQQLDFLHLPPALHAFESRLSELRRAEEGLCAEAIRELHARSELLQALRLDLGIIEEALGAEFLQQRERTFITRDQADRLEAIARYLLEEKAGHLNDAASDLLRELSLSRRMSLKSLLGGYPKAVLQLAERMGKAVHPLRVEGDDIQVDPNHIRGFTKTLIHVFRNAVDHGIESPEDRILQGKVEIGRITCSITLQGGEIILSIADDGKGLDPEEIKEKAVSMGIRTPEEIERMDRDAILRLIFEKKLSTRETVTDCSGRGVGLSAVQAALDALGGRIEIETEAGKGATFRFFINDKEGNDPI